MTEFCDFKVSAINTLVGTLHLHEEVWNVGKLTAPTLGLSILVYIVTAIVAAPFSVVPNVELELHWKIGEPVEEFACRRLIIRRLLASEEWIRGVDNYYVDHYPEISVP